jgi:hypothetical protein
MSTCCRLSLWLTFFFLPLACICFCSFFVGIKHHCRSSLSTGAGSAKPLLFPCSRIARRELTDALATAAVPCERLSAYDTCSLDGAGEAVVAAAADALDSDASGCDGPVWVRDSRSYERQLDKGKCACMRVACFCNGLLKRVSCFFANPRVKLCCAPCH